MTAQTLETTPHHKSLKNNGLHILKASPSLMVPTVEQMVFWPNIPYENIIKLLLSFLSKLYQSNETSAHHKLSHRVPNGSIAWISKAKPDWSIYPTAIESRGLMLKHILFIETQCVEKSLHKALQQELFKGVVVVAPESRAIVQMARQWLKPRDGPQLCRANEVQESHCEKVFVYAQEETQALRRSHYLLNS